MQTNIKDNQTNQYQMNEIICPHCKKAFKVDEAGFADIVKQVRDHQFQEELENRLNLAEKEKENAVKLAEANLRNSLQESLAKKDKEILQKVKYTIIDHYKSQVLNNDEYNVWWDKFLEDIKYRLDYSTDERSVRSSAMNDYLSDSFNYC